MKKQLKQFWSIIIIALFFLGCSSSDSGGDSSQPADDLGINYILFGGVTLSNNAELDLANQFLIKFNKDVDPNTGMFSLSESGVDIPLTVAQGQTLSEIIITPNQALEEGTSYTFVISADLVANDGATFEGRSYNFSINLDSLELVEANVGSEILNLSQNNIEVPLNEDFTFVFSYPVLASDFQSNTSFSPNVSFSVEQIDDYTIRINLAEDLMYWKNYEIIINQDLGSTIGRPFDSEFIEITTTFDNTDKFPVISDDQLLTLVQEETFKYFWDFGHPISGMARERNTSNDVVTTGGTGFGIMAMIVGVERGFITRSEAVSRWETIINFLESADRYHGAWPHWLNGATGNTVPFSQYDDGADLVETALLTQGLLTLDQYLSSTSPEENILKNKINTLWQDIEWNWFTKGGENVLYWHWSPNYEWQINLKIQGHNETQIVYILAAASPTYSITQQVYNQGYAQSGNMVNGNSYFDYMLPLGNNYGGPLFFSHYSYLGLDPRNLQDQYANYWTQNVNHTLINRSYCIENPQGYLGYYNNCWGLTASDNNNGYSAHSPTNDLGVITPTAAISSIPYTPTESMEALRFFYYKIGDRIWGQYGFKDAFNPEEEWYANSFLAIDQGPQIIMIENYRTQLFWNLFMQNEDVQNGLNALGFSY